MSRWCMTQSRHSLEDHHGIPRQLLGARTVFHRFQASLQADSLHEALNLSCFAVPFTDESKDGKLRLDSQCAWP